MQPDPPSSAPSSSAPSSRAPSSREPVVSSEPSSLFGRMVDAFGGWSAIEVPDGAAPTGETAPDPTIVAPLLRQSEPPSQEMPCAAPGTVLLDRYLLGAPMGRPELRLFRADDRSTRRPVTVQLVASDGDRESLMSQLRRGRSVAHRNVLRVHDVASTAWGALIVMEAAGDRTLEDHLDQHRASGGVSVDEIRRIGGGVAAALAAIHEQGLVHGRVEPGMILLTDGAPRLLASLLSQTDLPPARGGSFSPEREPFHSPERARGDGASVADDLYAFGMVLWSMSARSAPAVDVDPRALSLRSDALHDQVSRLTPDELRQLHSALSPDPTERPAARTFRFFDSRHSSPTLLQRRGDFLYPGPPPSVPRQGVFPPSAMSLFVTYSATAPELVGQMFSLRKDTLTLGRDPGSEVSLGDRTVSTEHALLVWRKGAWIISDRRSTNGTYSDPSYIRRNDTRLRHGGEVQFGELRAMLVTFQPGSPEYLGARAYLARRDGLTGLLLAPIFFDALRSERRFAEWADLQLHLAIFEIQLTKPVPRERLAVLELLVLRRLARRVTELTDALLVNLRTATAGLVPAPSRGARAPLVAPRVVVSWIGLTAAQARMLLDTMLAELEVLMPPGLTLRAALVAYVAGSEPESLVDAARTH